MADSHSTCYLSHEHFILLGDKTLTPNNESVTKLFRNQSRLMEILKVRETASCGKLSVLHANAYMVNKIS